MNQLERPRQWVTPFHISPHCWAFGEFPHEKSANPLTADTAIIDPGANYSELRASLAAIGMPLRTINFIFLTHLHVDHSQVTSRLRDDIFRAGGNVTVFAPPGSKEVAALADPALLGTMYYPGAEVEKIWIDEELPPGVEVTAGKVSIKGFLTNGHTTPHMSYLITDTDGTTILASGDSVGGLIDPRTGSQIEEYHQNMLHTLALSWLLLHEGHGSPHHLLTKGGLERRADRTAWKPSDLRPGPYPQTWYPHH